MKKELLKTVSDHKAAVKRLEYLTDKGESGEISSEEEKEIDYLSVLINDFEEKHFPIGKPNPIEYIRYIIENKNLKQQDIVDLLGISKGTLSNILNYRKKLSINMIRTLHKYLDIPYDILMEDYELQNSD
jgi:HTH-type transcriptional regulator / antitoxin HigA